MTEKQPEETKGKLEYRKLDMTKLDGIDDGSVGLVLDKGSFDALCADDTPATLAKVQQYLNEVFRVLSDKGGMYMCVSLLQEFVFKALTDYTNLG